ncbi:Penicillin acylase family protein [Balamuthia mandrillaris]
MRQAPRSLYPRSFLSCPPFWRRLSSQNNFPYTFRSSLHSPFTSSRSTSIAQHKWGERFFHPTTSFSASSSFSLFSEVEVQQWLKSSNFASLAPTFVGFTGEMMLQLTKEECQQLVGGVGIPLHKAIQSQAPPLLSNANLGSGEGVNLLNPVITHRTNTCDSILSELSYYKAGLVRAPPYSGKTSLAILLRERLSLQGKYTVFAVSMLAWAERSGSVEKTLEHWLPPIDSWPFRTNTVIIIDEAQLLYPLGSNHPFWRTIKMIQQNAQGSCYVLLIASYGERVPANTDGSPASTPISFSYSPALELVSLTKAEYDEFLDNYSKKSWIGHYLSLSTVSKERIFNLTNGHAGLVRETLLALERKFSPNAKGGPAPTDSDVMAFLLSNAYISQISSTRAVPTIQVEEMEVEVLKHVLINDSYPFPMKGNSDYPACMNLVRTSVLAERAGRLVFVAPVIRSVFLHHLYRSPLQKDLTSDFDEFVLNSISRLNPHVLKNTLSRVRDGLPVERQWQMEYYRAATTALPANCMSPDVGPYFARRDLRNAGKLDFYVNGELSWAIELLREGSEASQHKARFGPNGIYKDIPISRYALLDFRSTQPKVLEEHFWYILVEPDFSGATIKHAQKADVKVKFFGPSA